MKYVIFRSFEEDKGGNMKGDELVATIHCPAAECISLGTIISGLPHSIHTKNLSEQEIEADTSGDTVADDDRLADCKQQSEMLEKQLSAQEEELVALQKENHDLKSQVAETQLEDITNQDSGEFLPKAAVETSIIFTFSNVTKCRANIVMSSPEFNIHGLPFKFKFSNYHIFVPPSDYYLSLNYLGDSSEPVYHFYIEVKLEVLIDSVDAQYVRFIQGMFSNVKKGFSIKIDSFIGYKSVAKYLLNDTLTIRANILASPLTPRIILPPYVMSLRKQGVDILTNSADGIFVGEYMDDRALSLLNSGLGSDCKFLVGREENRKIFSASRILLARASPVLEGMLYGDSKGQGGVVEIPDIAPDVFRKLLEAVYGCKWQLESRDEALQLCLAAQKYLVMDIIVRCIEHVWPTSHVDMWQALDLATRLHQVHLEEAVMEIVRRETQHVFASKQFLGISLASLIAVLKQYRLNVCSETEVFWAMVNWAKHKCREQALLENGPNLRIQLGTAVRHVRFLTMTYEEFSSCQTGCTILTLEEMVAVMGNINVHQNTNSMKLLNLSLYRQQRLK